MRFFKTLIVEDNPLFRQTVLEALRNEFPAMVVDQAADGRTALEKIERSIPDLIFMDIKLPGENGLHLTEHIKKRHPDVFVIILTSYDWPEYREAAFNFGADYFVVKGSSHREIVEVVSAILEKLGFLPTGAKNNGAP